MTLLAPPLDTVVSPAVAAAALCGTGTASLPGLMSSRAPSAPVVEAGRFEVGSRVDLRHGGSRDVTIRGEWCGPADAPVVLVAGGISAHRHVTASARYASPGWWEALAGPHRALDPTRQRLVAIDWLGIDGDLDVPIDSADQAAAFVAVLDHLGVPRAAGFVGASYGGMVGLQLAAAHPDRLARLVVVSAAHRPHPYATAWRGVQRRILALGRATGAESEALSLARQLAMLSYRTPAEFNERFAEPPTATEAGVTCAADGYLEACGARFADSFDPTAWLRLSESIDLHRVDPTTITVPTTAVGVAEDRLVPLADVAELVAWLSGPGELQVVRSTYGHDAFLKEPDAVGRVVRQALRGIEGGAA
jgi:homoserine O-acetyltransferase